MSDIEEPPSKLVKTDLARLAHDETLDSQETGQEEWLSEGVLTDDDLNRSVDQDGRISQLCNTSQEDSQPSLADQSMEPLADNSTDMDVDQSQETNEIKQDLSNVEDTLNSLENESFDLKIKQEVSLNEDLGMFLIRKADGHVDVVQERKFSSELDEEQRQPAPADEDDGNNTDELLRMLGDDGKKSKKLQSIKTLKSKKPQPTEDTTDDDDFEGAQVTSTMKVASKTTFLRQYPGKKSRVSRQDNTDTDGSDDEAVLKYRSKSSRKVNVASKSTSKPAIAAKSLLGSGTKAVLNDADKKASVKPKPTSSAPVFVKIAPAPPPPTLKQQARQQLAQLEDDVDEMDDLLDGMFPEEGRMRPERMDEELPTDEDTELSDDGSLYDEMMSSESEVIGEWFALDIRAERAGDYIPLLGHKAYDLLAEEKKRVLSKLSTLRDNITALSEKSKEQTQQIEEARRSLAEVDTLLTHT